MKALLVFGARPNYMKIAPLYRAMVEEPSCAPILVNTGQHFDREMAEVFVDGLGLPQPDFDLEVGPCSQAEQIARVLLKLEPILRASEPDVTVVVGDVNSTLAAALASATVGVPVAHVEAGLRSRDWSMPEERNRVLTDRLSRYLFTPSEDANENLSAEGIERDRIHFVGNVMIDTLDWVLPRLPRAETKAKYDVPDNGYGLVTLHRPSNVDDAEVLREIVCGLETVGQRLPLFFTVHPRTERRLADFSIPLRREWVRPLPPLGYPEFISLLSDASFVITDSGGIQEESTVLGIPCLTMRANTERPITLACGSNELVRSTRQQIVDATDRALTRKTGPRRPPLWDGSAAGRIVAILCNGAVPNDTIRGVEEEAAR